MTRNLLNPGCGTCDECEVCPCDDYSDEWYAMVCGLVSSATPVNSPATSQFFGATGGYDYYYYWDIDIPAAINNILQNWSFWSNPSANTWQMSRLYADLSGTWYYSYNTTGNPPITPFVPITVTIRPLISITSVEACDPQSRTFTVELSVEIISSDLDVASFGPLGGASPSVGFIVFGDYWASGNDATEAWPFFDPLSNCNVNVSDATTVSTDLTADITFNSPILGSSTIESTVQLNLGGGSPVTFLLSREVSSIDCS